MTKIAVVYHSGYGHTAKVAEAVAEGARMAPGTQVSLYKAEALTEQDWSALDAADGIIMGAPTYMGSLSAPFKAFMDASAGRWFNKSWHNKVAAGFTNSGSYSGDKLSSLIQLAIFAGQHGMIWVGQSELPTQVKGIEGPDSNQINRLGGMLGLMAQANNDDPAITPPKGDLETARIFGKRVATAAAQFARGRVAAAAAA